MTEPTPNVPGADPHAEEPQRARFRWPHVDFVTVMFALLIIFLLLFLTAEMWLPHHGD